MKKYEPLTESEIDPEKYLPYRERELYTPASKKPLPSLMDFEKHKQETGAQIQRIEEIFADLENQAIEPK